METSLLDSIGVVDLFAGPGGLGEGFASFSFRGRSPFRVSISVEKEESAHDTLKLRAFLRAYRRKRGKLPPEFLDFHIGGPKPDWSTVDAEAWRVAAAEARCLELGTAEATTEVNEAIDSLKRHGRPTVLIGGPPCQAYSLVGRARSRGIKGYVAERDHRHYLFREYIRVLRRLEPSVFVMENVKGILSSKLESQHVFEMLMQDLSSLGQRTGHRYELRAVRVDGSTASLREASDPTDFVIRAEQFGVPQRRHRVIVIGIRSDLAPRASRARIDLSDDSPTVDYVIGSLPRLRSGISRAPDSADAWQRSVAELAARLARTCKLQGDHRLHRALSGIARGARTQSPSERESIDLYPEYGSSLDPLLQWLEVPELRGLAQHFARGHMVSDLGRYMFAGAFGKVRGYSPKASDFPVELSPEHRNWRSGIFADRFRVQLANEPATTVTSHISKDGHYFIHPDPVQCRSLTVREAARIQTFPDDYVFAGNRTQQYVQVGNAVPPYLARQLSSLIWDTLC